jgi:hypothetical protein
LRAQNAFEHAELILQAALDPTIACRPKRGNLSRVLITSISYKLLYIERPGSIHCSMSECPARPPQRRSSFVRRLCHADRPCDSYLPE